MLSSAWLRTEALTGPPENIICVLVTYHWSPSLDYLLLFETFIPDRLFRLFPVQDFRTSFLQLNNKDPSDIYWNGFGKQIAFNSYSCFIIYSYWVTLRCTTSQNICIVVLWHSKSPLEVLALKQTQNPIILNNREIKNKYCSGRIFVSWCLVFIQVRKVQASHFFICFWSVI